MAIKQQAKPVLAAPTPIRRSSIGKVRSPAEPGLAPRPIGRGVAVECVSTLPHRTAGRLVQTALLDLQRTVGNRQVARLLDTATPVPGRSTITILRIPEPTSSPRSSTP